MRVDCCLFMRALRSSSKASEAADAGGAPGAQRKVPISKVGLENPSWIRLK
jgi:hypothetical protein